MSVFHICFYFSFCASNCSHHGIPTSVLHKLFSVLLTACFVFVLRIVYNGKKICVFITIMKDKQEIIESNDEANYKPEQLWHAAHPHLHNSLTNIQASHMNMRMPPHHTVATFSIQDCSTYITCDSTQKSALFFSTTFKFFVVKNQSIKWGLERYIFIVPLNLTKSPKHQVNLNATMSPWCVHGTSLITSWHARL